MTDTPLRVDIHNELMAFFTPGKHDFEDATTNMMQLIDQESTKRVTAALEGLRMEKPTTVADDCDRCHRRLIGQLNAKIDAAIAQAKHERP